MSMVFPVARKSNTSGLSGASLGISESEEDPEEEQWTPACSP